MLVRKPLDVPAVFWATETALLSPLALFWISVVTRSEYLSQLLFGPYHTPFRDLLPVLILPGVALLLGLVRLRKGIQDDAPIAKPDRNATMIVSAMVGCSIAVAVGFSILENIRGGH